MASIVYSLCALMAILVAWLLLQAYAAGRYRRLLWSGLCFVGLAANNVLLVIDKVIVPDNDRGSGGTRRRLPRWRRGHRRARRSSTSGSIR